MGWIPELGHHRLTAAACCFPCLVRSYDNTDAARHNWEAIRTRSDDLPPYSEEAAKAKADAAMMSAAMMMMGAGGMGLMMKVRCCYGSALGEAAGRSSERCTRVGSALTLRPCCACCVLRAARSQSSWRPSS